MTTPSRRHLPRLSFAGRVAPRLETPGHSWQVLDLSPEGLRFRVAVDEPPAVTIGDVLRATIRFPADRSVEIEGRIKQLRIEAATTYATLTWKCGRSDQWKLWRRPQPLAEIAKMLAKDSQ